MKDRAFRDRDFLRTKEGFFFCVVGPYHPADRAIGYLKYVPDRQGNWGKGEKTFKRVMQAYTIPSLLNTFNLLKAAYSHYLFFSEAYNITMTAVPREYISEHFRPEAKLVALSRKSDLDELQNKVVRLVTFLSRISGVPFRRFGVTGSILIDIHNPAFSDMDITVYGIENSYEVKEGLTKSCSAGDSIRRFKGEKLRNWCRRKATHYPITAIEAEWIYERKWNMGVYEGTFFSVHPVKLEAELEEEYGDKTYCPAGDITIQAVIADSKDSIFLPAVYQVKDVEAAGNIEPSIEEVVSYEGLYDSLGEKDEQICVKGKLEHVTDHRTGRTYDRVLVGSPEGKGKEYLKLIS